MNSTVHGYKAENIFNMQHCHLLKENEIQQIIVDYLRH